MAITAALVKELRERTGAGMMDCKKHWKRPAAISKRRSKTCVKVVKRKLLKAGRVAAEGVILTKTEGNTGTLVELNCRN